MFLVALFINAPNWNQPEYPSTGEWINIVSPYNEL